MKTIIITFLTLFLTFSAFSQRERIGNRDKIQALKVAYITEQLNLTPTEAEKFWPIYNAFETQQEQLRKSAHEKRKSAHIETLTEAEAQKLIDDMDALGKQRYELNSNYFKNLRKVLPAKKIILLKEAEENFRRKMIKEFRNRKSGKLRNRP